ncbi:MAG: hypothetical protein U0Z75_02285 [Deinococcaceae bacterium]
MPNSQSWFSCRKIEGIRDVNEYFAGQVLWARQFNGILGSRPTGCQDNPFPKPCRLCIVSQLHVGVTL